MSSVGRFVIRLNMLASLCCRAFSNRAPAGLCVGSSVIQQRSNQLGPRDLAFRGYSTGLEQLRAPPHRLFDLLDEVHHARRRAGSKIGRLCRFARANPGLSCLYESSFRDAGLAPFAHCPSLLKLGIPGRLARSLQERKSTFRNRF